MTRQPLPAAVGLSLLILALAGTAAEGGTADLEPGIVSIERAFLREEFPTVVQLAQEFLQGHREATDAPHVWLWLIFSLDRLGQSQEALRQLEALKARLVPHDPLWPEVWFWEGEISRRAFQMPRAITAYERLLETAPESSWAAQTRIGLGLIALYQRRFEDAAAQFHEVARRYEGQPSGLDARLFEGLCNLRLGLYEAAAAGLAPLLTQLKDPAMLAQAAFYLGESLTALDRYDEAASSYHRAISAQAASQWARLARFGLGWTYYRAGRCEESVEAFTQYLRQSNTDHRTEVLFAQGACLLKLGREGRALERFEQIVSREPEHPLAVESGLAVADLYRRQGRLPLAQGVLHALLRPQLDPSARSRIQQELGEIALDQGNVAKARTIFELAGTSDDPATRQDALMGLGDVQVFLGDLVRAKRCYEDAAAIAGEQAAAVWARYQIGRITFQLGEIDHAIDIFRPLAAGEDRDLADEAHLALALAYLTRREPELARVELETVKTERAGRPVAQRVDYYLALLALSEGDEKRSRALCRQVIEQVPTAEEAVDARLLLADLMAGQTEVRDAMRWLEEALAAPGLPARHRAKLARRLGDLARSEGAYAEAVQWYRQAQRSLPAMAAEADYLIASCYEEQGQLTIAIESYRKIGQMPWRVRGQLAAGKLLERQGRPEEAEAIYEALSGEPIPEAQAAQEHLATLRDDLRHEPP